MFNFSQNSEYLSEQEIIELLKKVESGFKTSTDPFFEDCNKLLKPFVKQGIISFEDEEDYHTKNPVVCNVPGCNQEFETVFTYEAHYNSLHRYLCTQCKKSLPTPHLLDLHLSEHHDSFFAVQSQRQPMYACFIEECQHKSNTPEERKDHCITFHKFPSNYRFDTCTTGKKAKKDKNCEMDIVEDDANDENKVCQASEKTQEEILKKLKSFSFGHSKTKTFNVKNVRKSSNNKKNQKPKPSVLENDETFTDIRDSLPDQ